MMRPTKNIQLLNGEIVDRPSWRTASNWLHVDQNPLYHPDFARVQGLICLSEHNELSGGFECVPGFHTKFAQWAKNLPEGYLKVKFHSFIQVNINSSHFSNQKKKNYRKDTRWFQFLLMIQSKMKFIKL